MTARAVGDDFADNCIRKWDVRRLSFCFIFSLIFFTILRLYMACKMWKITALT